MKIGIDIQTTLGQKTGFGNYVLNMVEQFKRVGGDHEYVLIAPNEERDLSAPKRFWWDQWTLPIKARQAGVSILHQPAFSAPFLFAGKVVLTVHDLIAIFYGQDIPFWSRQYFGRWMPFSYRRADAIICISEHTKKDVIRVLGLPEEKITVTYLAAGSQYHPVRSKVATGRITQKYRLTQPYLLHVGTVNPRKNLEFLVKVFAEVVKSMPSYKLVITGKKGWYSEGLFKLVQLLGLTDHVIFTGYIDDRDKPALYSGASLFLFPSLYEGFGLPLLEAMQCGVPVISANGSSMPEVAGRAGILLPPDDINGWVKTTRRVLASAKLRQTMVSQGLVQAKKFSWSKTARETVKVYESLML